MEKPWLQISLQSAMLVLAIICLASQFFVCGFKYWTFSPVNHSTYSTQMAEHLQPSSFTIASFMASCCLESMHPEEFFLCTQEHESHHKIIGCEPVLSSQSSCFSGVEHLAFSDIGLEQGTLELARRCPLPMLVKRHLKTRKTLEFFQNSNLTIIFWDERLLRKDYSSSGVLVE